MTEQHLLHDAIRTINNNIDVLESEFLCVRESAFNDMCNPVGICVRHGDRVERHSITPVSGDDCCLWTTQIVEPE